MDGIAEITALGICVVAGIIFCFMGNRWLKVILAVYGFAVGFIAAHNILPGIFSLTSLELLLCSLGVGLVGALLFVFLLYLGIFFIGFGCGLLLSVLIADALGYGANLIDWYIYVPILVVGSVLGSITLNMSRIFISIFTSFIGAALIALGIFRITAGGELRIVEYFTNVGNIHGALTAPVFIITLAVLFAAGIVVQLLVTSKNKSMSY